MFINLAGKTSNSLVATSLKTSQFNDDNNNDDGDDNDDDDDEEDD